jgi:hypothetical protein
MPEFTLSQRHSLASMDRTFGTQGRFSIGLATLVVSGALVSAGTAHAAKRCDWHGQKAFAGEAVYRKCLDLAALDGKSLTLPKNVSRVAQDGFSFCRNAFRTEVGKEADILYLLDNSGSMWSGDADERFNSCAGDPFLQRGKSLIQAINVQSQLAARTSAGFIPFKASNEIQNSRVVSPREIGNASPSTTTNLQTLRQAIERSIEEANPSDRTDRCADIRDQLLKSAAVQKVTATYWTNALEQAIEWMEDDPLFSVSKNRAIVLVSDGAISDWAAVKALVPQLPPVYGIHLGYRLNFAKQPDYASSQLDSLTRLTGGKFFRVAPTDTLAMRNVLGEIVRNIVSNPLPQSLNVTNQSLDPAQISRGDRFVANPDTSVGVVLDSILALKEGANELKVDITLNDATTRSYSFTLNVTGNEASRNSDQVTCYDMPAMALLGTDGKPLELYGNGSSNYTLDLTRSPSELTGVAVTATSADSSRGNAAWGDRETITLGAPSMALGIPQHTKEITLNGRSDAPRAGNGTLESSQAGSVTLTWSHPRDPRETVTYTLPGKIIPVVPPVGDLRPPKEPARGPESFVDLPVDAPKVILSIAPQEENGPIGACISGCDIITTTGVEPDRMPTWTLPVNAPFDYEYSVFDNLGQYISNGKGSFTLAQYEQARRNTDTAKVAISLVPVTHNGRHFGTGAYIMRLSVTTRGETVTRNAAGDEVRVRSTQVNQTRRFGYMRGNTADN